MRVPNIVKNDDGGLPGNFWLELFRDWLLGKLPHSLKVAGSPPRGKDYKELFKY
jgi:hypothetical protein